MLTILLGFVRAGDTPDPCSAYNSSCLLCMQHDNECFYCFGEKKELHKCVSLTYANSTTCTHKTKETDAACVQLLGGDAVPATRYIIGSVILAIGIIVDLVVRFCSSSKPRDEYAHL
ncbi:hypothetical protein TVAG_373360 [Trichomonas vaginalis G3]|uniref:Uncharacterized protein n=1 Tax=Trichomonas vaginalis (strain ATCC PRA-98 / G3) TaxID=412133 RepID=A2DZJ9_TRIV3|nr:hypothetical protein TVAGG3_0012060 [Trichomonas vaginalis G3]EAY14203.1 hypothetical protein TVAG_373360 [Trichomonas vaginalis G3]KAI5539198.1 hypothetical protein TVAGG3_0012060 [Trichomonas vaginalis G3]|eukprot:XP_001326426.1 hypothetical protein [Trichomonas vaginalis G3]